MRLSTITTILTIKKLHQGEICEMTETQNLRFVDFALQAICIYLYTIRTWGVFGKNEVRQVVRGQKSMFLVESLWWMTPRHIYILQSLSQVKYILYIILTETTGYVYVTCVVGLCAGTSSTQWTLTVCKSGVTVYVTLTTVVYLTCQSTQVVGNIERTCSSSPAHQSTNQLFHII